MTEHRQPSVSNRPLQLKVCGMTQLSQIHELNVLGADYMGFIFYEKSPRYVLDHLSLKQIAEIPHQEKVGVFVNSGLTKIAETATEANLDIIQLHGDEDEDFILRLRSALGATVKIIKVIRVGNQPAAELQEAVDHYSPAADWLLFDTDSKAFGGTGQTFNWQVLNELTITVPYFLSGGISLENINELKSIRHQPAALDINSKFEIGPGDKDTEKIKKLLNLLKGAH